MQLALSWLFLYALCRGPLFLSRLWCPLATLSVALSLSLNLIMFSGTRKNTYTTPDSGHSHQSRLGEDDDHVEPPPNMAIGGEAPSDW